MTNSLAKSNGNNYDNEVQINRFSLNGIYKINNPKNKWKHLFNSRIVLDKKNLSPLTFSYSFNRVLAKDFKIYINMGKVYRFPILMIYWSPEEMKISTQKMATAQILVCYGLKTSQIPNYILNLLFILDGLTTGLYGSQLVFTGLQ